MLQFRQSGLVIIGVLSTWVVGCRGGSGDRVTIKGTIGRGVTRAPLASDPTRGDRAILEQGLRTSAGPVAGVLLYRGFGLATRSAVGADGRFAIDAERDQPAGLVFLDASDAVVGTLALRGGIAAIPIHVADAGVTEVSLASIDFDGGVGTPGSDPLEGGALALTPTEEAAWALQSTLFTTLVRNLDMDQDDALDVLSSRRYWLMFGSTWRGGQAATSEPPAGSATIVLNDFRLSFSDRQPFAQPATLRLPNGTTLDRVSQETRWAGDRDGTQVPTYVWPAIQEAQAFTAGNYRLTYGNPSRALDFQVSAPLTARQHIVASDLWWDQPSASRVTLHWRWRRVAPDGSSAAGEVEVSRLLKLLIASVAFRDGTKLHRDSPDPGATSFTFDLNGRAMDQVSDFSVAVRDLFGNEYSVSYRR